mgnify:CR=1 FL=1
MKAISPTGSPIIGTADMVPANALAFNFERTSDGSLTLEWAGQSDMCWNGQYTKQTGGAEYAAEDLLAAAKAALDDLYGIPGTDLSSFAQAVRDQLKAAIAMAEAPRQTIFVDEEGEEWPEDQIKLVAESYEDASQGA